MGQSLDTLRLIAAGAVTLAPTALLWATGHSTDPAPSESTERVALGRRLFFDPNLSYHRTQSCATCHDPGTGFADPRDSGVRRAVSLGDDGRSLGDRNAPTASYAALSPRFHRTATGTYVGGQFHDGRAPDLAGQAGGPPLNPLEMGMPDKAAVVARLREDPVYVQGFAALFGPGVWDDTAAAYRDMTQAIAAFEKTNFFAPFDSKYDRHLRGEYRMTEQEELGMTLFFSTQFTNCHLCHQLHKIPASTGETFSNYEHHNIGVPANTAVRALNGQPPGHVDPGLSANPAVQANGDAPGQRGRFKTPTLRNVAVTGPYMHNGVFHDLRTVVLFYNQYNSKAPARRMNPETGAPWAPPEVPENLSLKELETGPALDDQRIDALVAFLRTLTDRRYEHLPGVAGVVGPSTAD